MALHQIAALPISKNGYIWSLGLRFLSEMLCTKPFGLFILFMIYIAFFSNFYAKNSIEVKNLCRDYKTLLQIRHYILN